jgi:hypothetical protein
MNSSSEIEKDYDEEARPRRDLYIAEFPEEVLFTKPIDICPEKLDEWRPQGVTSERRVRDEVTIPRRSRMA